MAGLKKNKWKGRGKLLALLLISSLLIYKGSVFLIHKLDLRPYLDQLATRYNYSLTKKDYKKHCTDCHEEQRTAFKNRAWLFGNSYSEIFSSIKEGQIEAGMPAYAEELSNREIRRISKYIINSIEQQADQTYLLEDPDRPEVFTSNALQYTIDTVVCSMDIKIPWGLGFLPNDDILITDRSGSLFRYSNQDGLELITGTPKVYASGQGGLLDIEVHPDFEHNATIYLSYANARDSKSSTTVMMAQLNGNQLEGQKVIFDAHPYKLIGGNEYGSRLTFGKNDQIYISVGHRGVKDKSIQNLDNDLGKVHRLNDDGSIPADNPFIGLPDASATIFSYGHRNPQGLAQHPVSGEIWSSEHGPRGGDEINILQKGNNYGWAEITYGIDYDGSVISPLTHKEGMEQPIHYWVPAIAPSGMDFVRGDLYPGWEGSLLVASLKYDYIARMIIEEDRIIGEEAIAKGIGRVRDVQQASDGQIYFTVEGLSDYAIRAGKPGCVLKITAIPKQVISTYD